MDNPNYNPEYPNKKTAFKKKLEGWPERSILFGKKNFVYVLIGSGFLGFAITMVFYFTNPGNRFTFHEIEVNKNELIDRFNLKHTNAVAPIVKKTDSLIRKIDSSNVVIRDSINPVKDKKSIINYRDSIITLKDTSFLKLKIKNDSDFRSVQQYVSLSRDALRKFRSGKSIRLSDSVQVMQVIDSIDSKKSTYDIRNVSYSLEFLVADSVNKEFPFRDTLILRNKPYYSNTDFFIKYPDFGLWAIGVTTIISVWLVLIIVFIGDMYVFKGKVMLVANKTGLQISMRRILGFILYSFILVLIFYIVQLMTVYDKTIIPENIFIENYKGKFHFLLIAGGIIASIFFGGYLIMGDILKECMLKLAEPNADDETKKQLTTISEMASKNLNSYFIITALSLTAVIIITGILFTAVNNMDFSLLYSESFHKTNFLNYDTVYLFGGLYSLLILLFYLPLQLTFSQQKDKYKASGASDVATSVTAGVSKSSVFNSKDFWNKLKDTFAVTSPLLAGLIQMVIQFFTK